MVYLFVLTYLLASIMVFALLRGVAMAYMTKPTYWVVFGFSVFWPVIAVLAVYALLTSDLLEN